MKQIILFLSLVTLSWSTTASTYGNASGEEFYDRSGAFFCYDKKIACRLPTVSDLEVLLEDFAVYRNVRLESIQTSQAHKAKILSDIAAFIPLSDTGTYSEMIEALYATTVDRRDFKTLDGMLSMFDYNSPYEIALIDLINVIEQWDRSNTDLSTRALEYSLLLNTNEFHAAIRKTSFQVEDMNAVEQAGGVELANYYDHYNMFRISTALAPNISLHFVDFNMDTYVTTSGCQDVDSSFHATRKLFYNYQYPFKDMGYKPFAKNIPFLKFLFNGPNNKPLNITCKKVGKFSSKAPTYNNTSHTLTVKYWKGLDFCAPGSCGDLSPHFDSVMKTKFGSDELLNFLQGQFN